MLQQPAQNCRVVGGCRPVPRKLLPLSDHDHRDYHDNDDDDYYYYDDFDDLDDYYDEVLHWVVQG